MSENNDLEFIAIVVDEIVVDEKELVPQVDSQGNVRGIFAEKLRSPTNAQKTLVSNIATLKVSDVEQKMSVFLGMISQIFQKAEQETKKTVGMSLDEIELSVEIGAEGEVRLIGSGAKASSKGAIKLKFKRQQEV